MCHLLCKQEYPFFSLGIDIRKIAVQPTGGQQFHIQDFAFLTDKSQVPLPPQADGFFFVGLYGQAGNIIVALPFIPQAIVLIKDILFHFRFLSVLFQDLLRLLSSVALGCHGQGAGRQQTLNDLALLKFDFLKGFWLENGIFSGEQDGKRKINPVSAFHFGSVFSSASADRDFKMHKKGLSQNWMRNIYSSEMSELP